MGPWIVYVYVYVRNIDFNTCALDLNPVCKVPLDGVQNFFGNIIAETIELNTVNAVNVSCNVTKLVNVMLKHVCFLCIYCLKITHHLNFTVNYKCKLDMWEDWEKCNLKVKLFNACKSLACKRFYWHLSSHISKSQCYLCYVSM